MEWLILLLLLLLAIHEERKGRKAVDQPEIIRRKVDWKKPRSAAVTQTASGRANAGATEELQGFRENVVPAREVFPPPTDST